MKAATAGTADRRQTINGQAVRKELCSVFRRTLKRGPKSRGYIHFRSKAPPEIMHVLLPMYSFLTPIPAAAPPPPTMQFLDGFLQINIQISNLKYTGLFTSNEEFALFSFKVE